MKGEVTTLANQEANADLDPQITLLEHKCPSFCGQVVHPMNTGL